jgi:hypothetical protein
MARGARLALGCLGFAGGLAAQHLLSGGAGAQNRLAGSDMAIFEAGEPRTDLACEVAPIRPQLGFDLKFHAGFSVRIPLRELAGNENLLSILFRVTNLDRGSDPVYLVQKMRVPRIEEDAKGDAQFDGYFDTGEGKFRVEWLMRDRLERVCSSSWEIEAALPAKDRQIQLEIGSGEVWPSRFEQFNEEPPVVRTAAEPLLNVKMLVNFAPQNPRSPMLRPMDTAALVQILRAMSREPRIGKFSLVAFNLAERRVVYRQADADRIDFPALGEAIRSIQPGKVDLKLLQDKNGDTEFLSSLIRTEMGGETRADAVIFAGPKVWLNENVPDETLRELSDVEYPVFYLNYCLNPQAQPWRDSIGRTVKFFRGTEFTVSRPRDLWYSVNELVSRVVKWRNNRGLATAAQ